MESLNGAVTLDKPHAEPLHRVPRTRRRQVGTRGRHVDRCFTQPGVDPFEAITWELRDCSITNDTGQTVFTQRQVEVPSSWSHMASAVVASKYLHGAPRSPQRENGVRALVGRVVRTIRDWGEKDGYFHSKGDAEVFANELSHILLHQIAAFNSPVWFNVGIQERPQCSACFILSVDDTLDSLLSLQTLESKIFKYGSGTGTNFSSIRSSRERLSGGGVPSGPISFMRAFDSWAGIIKSGGKTRRAAKMMILNADHPDIMEFISCKTTEEKKAWALIDAGYDGSFAVRGGAYDSIGFQNANLSVRVNDEFMRAVEEGANYTTYTVKDRTPCEELSARKVLEAISEATHACGDPGLQFDTTINAWHTVPQSGRINSSNPCSEYMSLDNSACNLSSINLLKFLSTDGDFDTKRFEHTVDIMLLAQDILVDRSSYPSEAIGRCASQFRQLGLGYTNLGALLMRLGLPYDSDAGRAWAAAITSLMTGRAYSASAELAAALEPFAGYAMNRTDMAKVMEKHWRAAQRIDVTVLPAALQTRSRDVWDEAKARGERSGYRNSQVTVLAPTGTISFMMDCDTTGIEPELALVKYKKLSDGGMIKLVNQSVVDALKRLEYSQDQISSIVSHIEATGTIEGAEALRSVDLAVFDCALKPAVGSRVIGYQGHLAMMAAVQPFISGAISKTVNLPEATTVDEIFNIYLDAWRKGLKAVALYRDGSKRTQPLNVRREAKVTALPVRRRLPEERPALTHRFTVGGLEGYLTVGLFDDQSPGEIFLVVAKEGSTLSGMMDAFATSVSMALQYGVPLVALVKKFSHMRFEPAGMTGNKDVPIAKSIIDYVFRWMGLRFLSPAERESIGLHSVREAHDDVKPAIATGVVISEDAPPCSSCGSGLMVRQGSCYVCLNCGSQGGCG
ncbi:MAG: vitamin B12-dependent ribonucleotide reductase [Bdellovibrionota bacterium]|nr:MAG: vitamin B12-dependent ribonucleotide reductase [Bdellovibrionota bacterium]